MDLIKYTGLTVLSGSFFRLVDITGLCNEERSDIPKSDGNPPRSQRHRRI